MTFSRADEQTPTVAELAVDGAALDRSGHVYRRTFWGGSLLGIAGLAGFAGAYLKFVRLGGGADMVEA